MTTPMRMAQRTASGLLRSGGGAGTGGEGTSGAVNGEGGNPKRGFEGELHGEPEGELSGGEEVSSARKKRKVYRNVADQTLANARQRQTVSALEDAARASRAAGDVALGGQVGQVETAGIGGNGYLPEESIVSKLPEDVRIHSRQKRNDPECRSRCHALQEPHVRMKLIKSHCRTFARPSRAEC